MTQVNLYDDEGNDILHALVQQNKDHEVRLKKLEAARTTPEQRQFDAWIAMRAEKQPEPKLTPVDLDALRNEISNAIAGRTPSIGLALLPHYFMAINLVFAKYKEGNK